MEKVLIVDCHAVCHAMKHRLQMSYESKDTGVIYGFLNTILKHINELDVTKIVFAWDSRKRHRRDIYDGYKVKEKEELDPVEQLLEKAAFDQFNKLRREILPALGFKNVFIQTGKEADDIIASIVKRTNGYHFMIASDDQDLYQLLDNADMIKLRGKKIYTKENLKKEWNCTPEEWGEAKIYAGCSGDKVPGIKGVGTKRALSYVHNTLEGKFLREIKTWDPELKERNRKLVVLPMPGTNNFQLDFDEKFDFMNIVHTCEFYGMQSLLKGKRLQAWRKLEKSTQD